MILLLFGAGLAVAAGARGGDRRATPEYRVVLVSIDDTTGAVVPVREFPQANIGRLREVLNDVGDASFSLPLLAPYAPEVTVLPSPPFRSEVQFWQDDEIVFWGMVVAASADAQQVTFELRSIEKYFGFRRPGPAAQVEFLGNPSFEDHTGIVPDVWIDATGPGSAVSLGGVPFAPLLGDRALHAFGADTTGTPPVAANRFIYQLLAVTAPATAALRFEVAVWHRALPGGMGALYENRALTVARYTFPGAVFLEEANATVNGVTADYEWHRISITMAVAEGTTDYIFVYLEIPSGFMMYDAASFRRKFATYTVPGEDRSVLAERLVNQAANGGVVANAQGGGPNGDLESEIIHPPVHIRWDASNPLVGDTKPVYIDHDTSADFLTHLQDFPRLGLADFWVDPTDGTGRTFRMAAPRRGSYKPEHTLELGRNIVDLEWGTDGTGVIDQPLINGADWSNTWPAPNLGDRDIWGQVSPTPESDLNQIEDFRPVEIDRRANPCPLRSVTVSAYSGAGQSLELGDTVPVRVDRGYMQVDQTLRILARTVTPGAETVTYELGLP